MHLKNIEMQGFKSFADKIYLDFNSGITAIVGPNGSGKSNISDAIKWVMGEQSVKSLRGSKMEDVIFAGTQTRKALGFAEVTLTLDNSDEYFNLDFPEVKVTRRVYRNGDSEYSINKTQCRLKDIHELFMDTGLGRDGYSIIGQGKIDNILSSKSEDRRQIFEEAAGISKYKYRKNEAERKLSQTTENLTRVTDILGELEVQIEPLKRQSEKAKSYLNLRDELKGLDITVSIMSIDKIKSELGGVDSEIDILESQVNSIKSEIEQSEVSIASMYDELEKYDDDMEGCRIADREISDLVHELNNKINIMLSDISHNNENVERLKTELENNNLSIKNLDDNIIKNKAELETLRSQNSAIDASLLELGETSRMAGSQASEKSSEVENLRSEIIIKTSKINTLKGNIENSKVLLENFTSRHDTINRELHDKSTNFDTLSMQCETLKENLSQNEKAGSALKEKILNAKNIHVEKSERYQNSLTEKNNLSLKLSQDSSKRKMLIDMENGFEGFAKGVKCVMTAYKSGNIKNANIHGPLSQLITTDKTYITAIETALGAASQNVVTQNESDAKTAINYLKERKLGRATFLPISAIKGKSFRSDTAESYDGFISIADKLVRCDGQYDNIVSSVLGTTVIVDTLDNAVKMAKGTGQKFRIVTLGGDVIQAGGAMTGGSAIRTAGSLSRSSEIESLGDEISKNEKNLLVIQEQISALITELNNIAETIKTDRDVLLSYNDDNIKMRSDMEHFQTMIKDLTENREHLELELSEMVSKIDHLNIDITSKTAEIELESTQINELDARITLEQKIFTELAGKNEELTTTLTNLSIRKNSVIKDIELQNERICRINDEKSTLANGLLQKNSEIETLKQKNIELDKQIVLTQNDVSASSVNSDQYKDKLEKVSHLKQKTETKIREKQSSIKEIQENMFTLSQRQTKLESRKSKNEVELENLVTHMWDDYELTYSEALKIKKDDDFDYTDASKRIKQIKDAIRNLGNINVDSIEEYKNVSERFEFLSIQTNDLKKAKIELEKIIGEMLTIMQSKFGEQFKIINENFNIVFAEMFGGGRANLTMTDPSNILESGIEIEAQPPGKKLQSLTLLSGGERAFTAIALLFAILNVRPTPFCILDEIEAALDDVNVYRYADYLKKYSDKTQFIVVTHRRGTMECANVLYGVTMQERGISKLLSLNIDEVKE